MAQNDILKRYLDAGLAFTQMTRERAEEVVQDLVKAGEVRRKEAQETIDQLLEWSRRNSEELVAIVRREVADQLRALGVGGAAAPAGTEGRTPKTEAPNAASSAAPVPEPAVATVKEVAKKAAAAKKAAKKKA